MSMIPGDPFGDPGTFHVTNLRLVFEAVGPGAPPRTLVNLDLRAVTNAVAGVGPKRQSILRVETYTGWHFTLGMDYSQNCAEWIAFARSAVLNVPPPPPPPPPESGKPHVYLHCKHCGTLNPAGTTRCASCGATL